jgi:hypothetical protein
MSISRRDEAAAYYRDLIRPVFQGRRVIIVGGPVAGLVGLAEQVRNLGSEPPFLIGSTVGTGRLPADHEAEWCSLDVRAGNIIEGFRRYESRLVNLPSHVRAALDRYDPDGRAMVIGLILLSDLNEVAGRKRYAAPSPEWRHFEDKVGVDAFWDAVGIRRAPSQIVAAEQTALAAAARELDQQRGTVWAGDARDGLNGGAIYVRWVRTPQDASAAARFFGSACARVRVMPFLEGIPCSIHGVVLPETVIAFRPIEIISLRRRGTSRLLYAGTASFWDPPSADREEMREIARRVGAALREQVSYRGPFTVDGVMTESGFLPTELNARFGAGIRALAGSLPGLPLAATLLAVQAGEPFDFRPSLLEEIVVEGADAHRGGAGYTVIPQERPDTEVRRLIEEGNRYRIARHEESLHGFLSVGPAVEGGFVHFAPDPAAVPTGSSLAPRVIRAFAAADREFGTEIGPLDSAKEVRT